MSILVTGANGFVGSAVMRRLLDEGASVAVMVRPDADRRNLDGVPVEIVEGDLLDPASLERAVKGRESLFHVAADYRLWVPDPQPMYAANVAGTRALLEAAGAAGVGRVVYTSSVAVLGLNSDGTPANEDTPVALSDMIGHYKRSKFLAEDEVKALARAGLNVTIVNPSTPIGPRDVKPTPTGKMIVEAASGRMPAYVDTGLNVVHVDDVAAGHLLAHEKGQIGERYILGGVNMTLAEILAEIARHVGQPGPRVRLPHDLLWPVAAAAELWGRMTGKEPFLTFDGLKMSKKRMWFSSAKARRELGYVPRHGTAALTDAADWFREAGMLK